MKNFNDIIWNRLCHWNFSLDRHRYRDLPVCSAVPQPLRHRVPPTFDKGIVYLGYIEELRAETVLTCLVFL
jgi:hypothetical protein